MTRAEKTDLDRDTRQEIETWTQAIIAELATLRAAHTLSDFEAGLTDLETAYSRAVQRLNALYEDVVERGADADRRTP